MKKLSICLENYDYRRDIENRLFMSQFTVSDIQVLEEILNSSLNISIDSLCYSIEINKKEILKSIEKLSRTGLFARYENTLIVDKEMRRYYDFQISKFAPDFAPDLDFIKGLLNKVPIEVLPLWYGIRSTDNIFQSIIDEFFASPSHFQKYVDEVIFEDEVLKQMVKEVYESDAFFVRSSFLRKKYQLSREEFEKKVLLLEFSFLCCLTYVQVGDCWEERMTPFSEWKNYLQFCKQTALTPVSSVNAMKKRGKEELSFIDDLVKALEMVEKERPVWSEKESASFSLPESIQKKLAMSRRTMPFRKQDEEAIARKMVLLQMVKHEKGKAMISECGKEWLDKKDRRQQALQMYFHSKNWLKEHFSVQEHLIKEKNLQSIERELRRSCRKGWVSLEQFIEGMTEGLGHTQGCHLKKEGGKWKYAIPLYLDDEKDFVRQAITQYFFEVGMVNVGYNDDEVCFCVTSLGEETFDL